MSKTANITVAGVQAKLLLFAPNWESGVQVSHTLKTEVAEGLSGIEARRPAYETLRLGLRYELLLSGADAEELRAALASAGSMPFAVPLWPDALPPSAIAQHIYSPQFYVAFTPATSAFALFGPGDDMAGMLGYALCAPLLVGRFPQAPRLKGHAPTLISAELALMEASPHALRIGVNAYGTGWTAEPNWISEPEERSISRTRVEAIDEERDPPLEAAGAARRWRQEAEFLFADRLEIRRALSAFVALKGSSGAFDSLPQWLAVSSPSAALPGFLRARFAGDTLSLDYFEPSKAEATVAFVQEISAPGYAQERPAIAFLYKLTYEHDAGNPELWTNWDAPLAGPGGTYQPAACKHSALRQSLKPQDEKAEFRLARKHGQLLSLQTRERLDAPLVLSIYECEAGNSAATARLLFEGVVRSVASRSVDYVARADILAGSLNRVLPRFLFQTRCNYCVFDALCGLNSASYENIGTLTPGALSNNGLTLDIQLSGWGQNGEGEYPQNLFLGGLLTTGSGRQKMVRQIVSSSSGAGPGWVTLNLSKPLWSDYIAPGGQSVTVLPGCDGEFSTCNGRFGNTARFGGFPFIPDYIEQRTTNPPKAGK